MTNEETIDFLKENGHVLMLWVKKPTLFSALKEMVSSQHYIQQLNSFYGIKVIEVYWTYSQMADAEQDYINKYSQAKHKCIKMLARRKKSEK